MTFTKTKKTARIDDVDVNKILLSKEEPYGTKYLFKYFIGYSYNDVIRPLWIKLSEIPGYVRTCESYTTMSFKINDKQLFKKYNKI